VRRGHRGSELDLRGGLHLVGPEAEITMGFAEFVIAWYVIAGILYLMN
jgi:hypothetical protein